MFKRSLGHLVHQGFRILLNDTLIEWAEKFRVLPAYESVEEPPVCTGIFWDEVEPTGDDLVSELRQLFPEIAAMQPAQVEDTPQNKQRRFHLI